MLFTSSVGRRLSDGVLFCFVGMATAKLNREKLKKMMSQQDEAPLTLGKKRKTDSSSKKVTDERSLLLLLLLLPRSRLFQILLQHRQLTLLRSPPNHRPAGSVEKVPTLPRDASLASRRAKSVVTKDDIGEYDKVNTDVIKVAGVHSLMKVWFFPFFMTFVRVFVFFRD
jgi:hypothetical protein